MGSRLISPATAYAIASQWGSYVSSSDPGMVFYTFPEDDARPVDESHRAQLIAHTDTCLIIARLRARQCGHGEDDEDVNELLLLRRFFEESESVERRAA